MGLWLFDNELFDELIVLQNLAWAQFHVLADTVQLADGVHRSVALTGNRVERLALLHLVEAGAGRIVALAEVAVVSPEVQQYVNRLSDYLFVLAKKLNFLVGRSEKIWQNACK